MAIPLLKVPQIPSATESRMAAILRSGFIADGEETRRFEEALGEFLGNRRVVTVNNESAAITLALYLAGVRPGDEVIASPMACTASTMPILNLFARPVWADIDPKTGMIDPSRIESRIGGKVKAILFNHWGGEAGDISAVVRAASRHQVKVIEDATESFGARLRGKFLGNHGADFTVFSFGPVRHVTTIEGGALLFRDEEDRHEARKLKRYGIDRKTFRDSLGEIDPKSDIPLAGYNCYLNNVCSAMGLEQLQNISPLLQKYYDHGTLYREKLGSLPGLTMLERSPEAQSSYWVFSLLAERSRDLIRSLKSRGIEASKLHLRNDHYSCYGQGVDESLSGVREFSEKVVCLPCGWWLEGKDMTQTVQAIKEGW